MQTWHMNQSLSLLMKSCEKDASTDWNGTRIYDLLVREQTLKHLAKVA